MMGGMPPMDDSSMMGGMPPMDDPNGGAMPTNDQSMVGGNDSSQFDTNFDAGVDADENSDPKKYIQQLTGKLSQSLRKYNENLPQPETDLCKYVAGMILKQTTEGLTDADKKEIIDKVNNGSDIEQPQDNGQTENGEIPIGDSNANGGEQGQQMMESINHRKLVNEIFQELTQKPNNSNYDIAPRKMQKIGFRKKPFSSPNLY